MKWIDVILGRPLASNEQEDVKIGVAAGVPAMGLDGLTSSAYGPEAALTILLPLGAAGLHYIGPLTLIMLALLAMLYFSYRQTIAAYPVNGGSYTVARENLGTWAGLLAAAALMIDYVLNVAVGISAGVAALVSAAPVLHHYMLPLCLGVLAIITLMNLRGTGEAGLAFAIPTYLFIATMLGVVCIGAWHAMRAGGHPRPILPPPALPAAMEATSLWLLLRSFASGCAAMTGVEAVSNGVSAFKPPSVPRAQRTLTWIVILLTTFLGGVAYLAQSYHIGAMDQDKPGYQSVLSQLTSAVAGRGWFYYVTIGGILSTLCLSANTSFVGFPRLCRLIARDDFLPRQFAIVGRRLVYSVGILFLAACAATLLIVFRGITDRLIPLFAVGAFLAFTLSQAGMVIHWRRELRQREQRRFTAHLRLWINGVGAVATGAALAIIVAAKFIDGAWITVLAVPALLILFRQVHRHYQKLDAATAARQPLVLSNNQEPVALVPTKGWDKLTEKALRFAMWLSPELFAVHLTNLDGEDAAEEEQRLMRQWAQEVERPARACGVPPPKLIVAQAPYRDMVRPLFRQIDCLKQQFPGRAIAVVVPEFVPTHWWQFILHRGKAASLRRAVRKRGDPNVVIVHVPWYLDD
ncbi:MAG TPA: APC family permease [Humisphaera sp.]|nr:APC family permease [Humisphaera sp.]